MSLMVMPHRTYGVHELFQPVPWHRFARATAKRGRCFLSALAPTLAMTVAMAAGLRHVPWLPKVLLTYPK